MKYPFFHYLFGFEYVLLKSLNTYVLKRARRNGVLWMSTQYGFGYCILLPKGKAEGISYIDGWIPVTPKMIELFNNGYVLNESQP